MIHLYRDPTEMELMIRSFGEMIQAVEILRAGDVSDNLRNARLDWLKEELHRTVLLVGTVHLGKKPNE